jgi:hypothetical protein
MPDGLWDQISTVGVAINGAQRTEFRLYGILVWQGHVTENETVLATRFATASYGELAVILMHR